MNGDYYLRTNKKPITGKVMVVEAAHPLVVDKQVCAACRHAFEPGARIVLVPLGPGQDPEDRTRARLGRFYNAISAVVHASCAGIP